MSVLLLTMFVSLGLVAAAVLLFLWLTQTKAFEHADRLALLPLELGQESKMPTPTQPEPNPNLTK